MKNEEIMLKANLLGGMNTYILNSITDENAHMSWLMGGVPDGADEDELMEIAADEECFRDCCILFGKLVEKYS